MTLQKSPKYQKLWFVNKLKSFLFRGGVLLGASAVVSKLLGFWRDRLLVQTFEPGQIDTIFAAFRIPDFFFYLLVGATISVVMLPRLKGLNEEEAHDYTSSLFWGVATLFGILCILGILGADFLTGLIASGLEPWAQAEVATLARFLFGSVFILSLSGVLISYLQSKQQFLTFALGPILYMGTICAGIYSLGTIFGILIVGYAAIAGALLHLLINVIGFYHWGGRLRWAWKKPKKAWKGFGGDFWRRVFNNAAFQINQTVDVWIASFLVIGSITAFSIGTTVGHVLLSIVGYSIANSAFPKLVEAKGDGVVQSQITAQSTKWILFWTVPFAIVGAFLAPWLLSFLFGLQGSLLTMTQTVFFWTVLSLPAGALIPLYSRVFLANDDTKTPLVINVFSLVVATSLALVLSLVVLPEQEAILGLALGNFTANYLSFILFFIFYRRRYVHQ